MVVWPFVALLAEGVDRNVIIWFLDNSILVALLAEGVDRNNGLLGCMNRCRRSPSSRRAWIEMLAGIPAGKAAASPSSRRAWIEIIC